MDAEFILVFIETKNCMNKYLLAEKSLFFFKSTQNGRFWSKCKGGTLPKIAKIGDFHG